MADQGPEMHSTNDLRLVKVPATQRPRFGDVCGGGRDARLQYRWGIVSGWPCLCATWGVLTEALWCFDVWKRVRKKIGVS